MKLVVLAMEVVLDAVGLLERLRGALEDPRRAAVDEQDAPALAVGLGDQRLDPGGAVDDHARVDGPAQRDDLEQPGGLAGEHRDAARAVLGDATALQRLAHALDVGLEPHVLVVVEAVAVLHLALRVVDHRGDRRGARRHRRELRRVQVEEDREDAAAVGPHVGEAAQVAAVDRVRCHPDPLPPAPGSGTRRGGHPAESGAVDDDHVSRAIVHPPGSR